MPVEQFANNPQTTLNGAINSSVTSLVVTSATGFSTSPQFRIIIDSEIMLVTAVYGTTFTITRGIEGTTAASHSNGATVTQILTADGLRGLVTVDQFTLTLANGATSSPQTRATDTDYKASSEVTKLRLDDPYVLWEFSDGSGTTAADSSGNSRTATLYGSPSWVTALIGSGYALDLNGTTQYGDRAASISLDGITVCAFVNVDSYANYPVVLSVESTSPYAIIQINFDGSGQVNGFVERSSGVFWSTVYSSTVSTGTTVHVAITCTSGSTKLYVNGVLRDTKTNTFSAITLDKINIGVNNYGGVQNGLLNGRIDNARVYARVLDADEIADIASDGIYTNSRNVQSPTEARVDYPSTSTVTLKNLTGAAATFKLNVTKP